MSRAEGESTVPAPGAAATAPLAGERRCRVGLPPCTQLSWFTLCHAYSAGTYVHHAGSRECLGLVLHAEGRMRSIVAGRESVHELRAGMVGVVPPDGARHTVVVTAGMPTAAFLVLVPRSALLPFCETEGLAPGSGLRSGDAFSPPALERALRRLWRTCAGCRAMPLAADEAARDLLVEVIHWGSGRRPDWTRDDGAFDRATMEGIVATIDAALWEYPALASLAAPTGLSPSHFARKFRRSTGLSVERFVNHRRVAAALGALERDEIPLAVLAARLGFSSQSHLTRLFSAWTGMTPSRYRRGTRGAGGMPPEATAAVAGRPAEHGG